MEGEQGGNAAMTTPRHEVYAAMTIDQYSEIAVKANAQVRRRLERHISPDYIPTVSVGVVKAVLAAAAEVLQPREGYEQPTMPRADWSQAPEWAMWHVIHASGRCTFYECEPVRYDGDGYWDAPPDPQRRGRVLGRRGDYREIELPLGCDWRLTKERRPEVQDA